MSVGSVIFGLAIAVVHTCFRLDANLRRERQAWASLERLGEQFRDDAHAAEAVAVAFPGRESSTPVAQGDATPPAAWIFRLPGNRQVEYSVSAEGIARIERVANKVRSRERYALPPGINAKLDLPVPPSRRIVLRLAPAESAGRQPAAQPLRIEALVAFDRRFAPKGDRP